MIKCLVADSWLGQTDGLFFTSFGPFTLLMGLTIKVFKKPKNAWRKYAFALVYQKLWSCMMLGYRDMARDRLFLSFFTYVGQTLCMTRNK